MPLGLAGNRSVGSECQRTFGLRSFVTARRRLFAALAHIHYTMLSQKYWSFTVIGIIFSDNANMLKLFEQHEMD